MGRYLTLLCEGFPEIMPSSAAAKSPSSRGTETPGSQDFCTEKGPEVFQATGTPVGSGPLWQWGRGLITTGHSRSSSPTEPHSWGQGWETAWDTSGHLAGFQVRVLGNWVPERDKGGLRTHSRPGTFMVPPTHSPFMCPLCPSNVPCTQPLSWGLRWCQGHFQMDLTQEPGR